MENKEDDCLSFLYDEEYDLIKDNDDILYTLSKLDSFSIEELYIINQGIDNVIYKKLLFQEDGFLDKYRELNIRYMAYNTDINSYNQEMHILTWKINESYDLVCCIHNSEEDFYFSIEYKDFTYIYKKNNEGALEIVDDEKYTIFDKLLDDLNRSLMDLPDILSFITGLEDISILLEFFNSIINNL